uniref:Uncharacterized protein n=1 Tax=Strigamia maritima TaxID=126957 RepID=T1JIA1_STRMM
MNLFLLGIFHLTLLNYGVPLRCYQCNDQEEGNDCMRYYLPKEECTGTYIPMVCIKMEYKDPTGRIIQARSCRGVEAKKDYKEMCKTENKSTGCICLTDLCNDANLDTQNKLLMFYLIFFVPVTWVIYFIAEYF